MSAGGVARVVGKLFFACGFVLAIWGLADHNQPLVNASLGLLVTGVLASGFAVYQHAKSRRDPPSD